ncbi:MAG: hypothetical protein N3C63_03500 [Rhodocyclaceae bacterium]|nr:hypothetical protein [Rhodocyclaceae bacterium]
MSPSAQLAILLTLKDMASGPLSRFGQIMRETSTNLMPWARPRVWSAGR